MNLTSHFTLSELTKTSTGLCNKPSPSAACNLVRLAEVLEHVRYLFGRPIVVNSAYRSQAVNAAVGGASNSFHLKGCAADIRPVDNDPIIRKRLFDICSTLRSNHTCYDVVELISEPTWIHIAIKGM